MIEVTPRFESSMNAGNYKPSLYGRLRTILYPTVSVSQEGILGLDVDLVDISFYQRFASFPVLLTNGVKGAIIRAGQNTWKDSHAETFMTDAEQAGMPIGSYWFFDSRSSPQSQAKLWKEVLGTHKTPLLCWADYEENYEGDYGGWDNFYQFLEACKREMPDREFGIYTGYYYWTEHAPNPITQAANLAYFGQYPLWLAWYAPDISYVKIPKPWTKMTFWQYTDKGDGVKYGVGSSGLDMNKFIGTPQEFEETFDLESEGGEMPTTDTYEGRVRDWVTAGAIVRQTPNGADTGKRIPAGASIRGTGELVTAGSFKWMNVTFPYVGWVAEHLLEYVVIPAPDPDPEPTPDPEKHVLEVYFDGVLEFRKEF